MALPLLSENANADELGEALKTSIATVTHLRSRQELSDDDKAELVNHARFVTQMDPIHSAAERLERAAAPIIPISNGPTVALSQPEQRERSLGQTITDNEQYQEFARSGRSGNQSIQINLERTLVTTATGTLWEPVQQPQVPVPITRRLFVRDLLSSAQVSGNSLTIMQESGTSSNELGATVVAEGASKPEVVLTWTSVVVPIRKIAAFLPLTTEIIEDAPALQGYVDNRLLYYLKLREELEMIAGDGTGAHILGIRNQTGLQTQAAVEADVPATVALAIAKIENVDGEADGVAMNPIDYWTATAARHTAQFDNGFGGNSPAVPSGFTWGLPVVRTRSLAGGNAIVGAWRQGGTVLDRSAAQIELGFQHSTFFVENKVAVRAEERVGLAVDRPALFVDTTIDHIVGP